MFQTNGQNVTCSQNVVCSLSSKIVGIHYPKECSLANEASTPKRKMLLWSVSSSRWPKIRHLSRYNMLMYEFCFPNRSVLGDVGFIIIGCALILCFSKADRSVATAPPPHFRRYMTYAVLVCRKTQQNVTELLCWFIL